MSAAADAQPTVRQRGRCANTRNGASRMAIKRASAGTTIDGSAWMKNQPPPDANSNALNARAQRGFSGGPSDAQVRKRSAVPCPARQAHLTGRGAGAPRSEVFRARSGGSIPGMNVASIRVSSSFTSQRAGSARSFPACTSGRGRDRITNNAVVGESRPRAFHALRAQETAAIADGPTGVLPTRCKDGDATAGGSGPMRASETVERRRPARVNMVTKSPSAPA